MSLPRGVIAFVLVLAASCRGSEREAGSGHAQQAPSGSAHAPGADHAHGSAAQPPPPAANPVQAEMRMLTEILELTVRSIGARDVRPIAHELHRLHAAKEATTAAVRGGTYKLPKNPDQVAAFEAMDEAFHGDLGKLVVASQANDVPAAADALGALVRACEGCHATFRP